MARRPVTSEEDFLDPHARRVHQFASDMTNLGLSRVAELLVAMLESGDWQEFKDGLGTYRFLPGEFDYFLTQRGIDRDHVLHGVRDIEVKAKLEAAMDERRTGEDGYRRRLEDVRRDVPNRPGRPIIPFGYNPREAKFLGELNGSVLNRRSQPALGTAVRRWSNSGGHRTQSGARDLPRYERIIRSAVRLPDEELAKVSQALIDEQKRRSK